VVFGKQNRGSLVRVRRAITIADSTRDMLLPHEGLLRHFDSKDILFAETLALGRRRCPSGWGARGRLWAASNRSRGLRPGRRFR
jgi:hypothetical protein